MVPDVCKNRATSSGSFSSEIDEELEETGIEIESSIGDLSSAVKWGILRLEAAVWAAGFPWMFVIRILDSESER